MESIIDLNSVEAVLFDLDGTIYYGPNIIPGANETIAYFRENGKKVFFTTNNSTKTRRQIYERLIGMGVDCLFDEVLTSGYLAALYAKKHNLDDLYIFGSQNLVEEFEALGMRVSRTEDARNLLIGYDPEMTYEGLTNALQVALHADCIMACNRERHYPGKDARRMPGCGAMTAPIEWCANRECDVVIGKPSTLMVDVIVDKLGVSPHSVLVIGDTYESDIAMAEAAGCQSILLDSGENSNVPHVASIREVPSIIR